MSTIGSYGAGAYAQTAIQERLSGQKPQVEERQSSTAAQSNREELFRALLKTSDQDSAQDARRARVEPDASQGRGQVVDLSV